jgi:hypothetical protein
MKRGPETFRAICASLESNPRYKLAAAKVGISEKTFYQWLGQSQQGDPNFAFHYLDPNELTYLHNAVKQATSIFHHSLIQACEAESLTGVWKPTFYKGQRQYERDPALDVYTDEQLAALGMDRYKRDANGQFIEVLEWHPPTAQLRLAVLAARAPRAYGTTRVDINQKTTLGVTVVKPAPAAVPPPVEVVATLPPPVVEADFDDPEADEKADYWQRAADAAVDDTNHPATGEVGNPEVSRAPSPLRAELEALAKLRAKNPRPTALVRNTGSIGTDRDDCGPATPLYVDKALKYSLCVPRIARLIGGAMVATWIETRT